MDIGLKDLINRLNCKYPIGQYMQNGEPEFGHRDTSGPIELNLPSNIMIEAADCIKRISEENSQLRQSIEESEKQETTLRDHFALSAMLEMVSLNTALHWNSRLYTRSDLKQYATASYEIADQMLKAREMKP